MAIKKSIDSDGDLLDRPEDAELDAELVEEMDAPIPDLEAVSYFGTDFDVFGLVRRLNTGDIAIPNFDPASTADLDLSGFQRKFVWKKSQMDRFIESLLLGFPVPGIFLVQQTDRKLLVLDGQQRLRTLQFFYSGFLNEGEFALESVADEFKGLTYQALDDDARRALDNTFIHATVVKYNPTQSGDESVYSLFERLNTGGTNLYPQEIRVALFHGELVEFIRELNGLPSWRSIYGPVSERLKDQEIILRFLAFLKEEASYRRPLKVFLNSFLSRHRNLEGLNPAELRSTFATTCEMLADTLGRRSLRAGGQINAAFADSMMVGMASRIRRGPIADRAAVSTARDQLLANDAFLSAIGRATADEDRVSRRLSLAKEAFRTIR
jgi:hypothetical protein